jgi:hypothetical protein
LTFCDRKPSM